MNLFGGILILVENPKFRRERPYDLALVGKSMREWVGLALEDCPFSTTLAYGEDFVASVKDALPDDTRYTVVLYSDTPLIRRRTVLEAVRTIERRGERALRLTRGWVFETEYLRGLTELPGLPRFYLSEEEDFMTCADYHNLALVTEILRQRILAYHMERGVYIVDPSHTYIDGDVVIGEGTTVAPNNILRGRTVLGKNVELQEGNVLDNAVVADGAILTESRVLDSFVGERSRIGPRAYVRPGCIVGADCCVGHAVELKKTKLGAGTKVAHLSYLGDCETGENCNIGGGVITANYDGARKYRTVLARHVFVGSNSTLIAPVTLGENAFVAAGSTITENADADALSIARARQVNLDGRSKWR